MVCVSPETGEIIQGTSSCMMCKRMVINAGISQVVIRDSEEEYRTVAVEDWVRDDDSDKIVFGY